MSEIRAEAQNGNRPLISRGSYQVRSRLKCNMKTWIGQSNWGCSSNDPVFGAGVGSMRRSDRWRMWDYPPYQQNPADSWPIAR